MSPQSDRDKVVFGVVILAIIFIIIALSCNSNKPKTDVVIPDNAEIENLTVDNTSTQVSNSVWPWMLVVVINNAIWVIVIFAYVYFSTRFPIIGRKPNLG